MGGKHLTNHLKEIISYRQLMVMDETYVINQVKEELCYVSSDFYNDMKIAKLVNVKFFVVVDYKLFQFVFFFLLSRHRGRENTIVRDYVLPDYANIRKGYAKSQEESGGRAAENEQVNLNFTILY